MFVETEQPRPARVHPGDACPPGSSLNIWKAAGAAPLLLVLTFLVINLILRVALFVKASSEIDSSPGAIAGVFFFGTFHDLVAACYLTIPLVLAELLLPGRWWRRGSIQLVSALFFFAAIYLFIFVAVAEWQFWAEFGARFNFIAVDYLIYTTEVLGNIRESYPIPAICLSIFILATLFFTIIWLVRPLRQCALNMQLHRLRPLPRLAALSPWLAAPLIFTLLLDGGRLPAFANVYSQELSRNGIYSFFSAYRHNELDYEQFYKTSPRDEAFGHARQCLASVDGGFLSTNVADLSRQITHAGPEKRYNVIQITVESLSAEFLAFFGNADGLTPNLDALANASLFFTNFYATGTRTVRGMEALTLSLPPTPGQSIVRRPGNENLFSLPSLFKQRGYDTVFLYGGYGYFDNMNYFFSRNGCRVVDRAAVASTNITFANAWGACDEDTFNWSLREADKAWAGKKPFYHFVMTTSNHRPYTYPPGRIDIPSHTGRAGAVKYTDYAIGKFLEQARLKPWFSNTLFVVVADHCASSAGRTDLPINRYEIPMIIYNPSLVPAKKIGSLCSQIDYAPTLLSLLNWSYKTKFFGKDILAMRPRDERAFIGSYQILGLLDRHSLEALKPLRESHAWSWDKSTGAVIPAGSDSNLLPDAISYYQTASYLFHNGLYRAFDEP